MRYSSLLIPTLRDDPGEAETVSHRLLLRAGMIRKVAAGIYTFLPLGYRVLKHVERIVREEMDRAGGQEILMPFVQPAELWRETGRWAQYGKELLRLKDRHDREFCLGPTHEEVVTDLVRREVKSYRQLPLTLYQIQAKFRDEIRPRFGLMRGREFLMKDAYSFDRDDEGSRASYEAMYQAYTRIFTRCGLTFRPVEADAGLIGGSFSHEFMVLAETGEEGVASCDRCGYAANVERAEAKAPDATSPGGNTETMQEAATPGKHTVADVAASLGVPPDRVVKTLLYQAGERVVAVLIRGDHEANEIKLKRHLKADEIALAADAAIVRATGGPKGFSGPVGLQGVTIVADHAAAAVADAVVGANKADVHLIHAAPFRDFQIDAIADLRNVAAGDRCPRCAEGRLAIARGIEVGHVFRLGTKYSEAMHAGYLDQAGVERPIVMGCYGIGVSRIVAAAVEQNHDAKGIVWPAPLSPFTALVIPLSDRSPAVIAATARLESELAQAGIDVLIDDRPDRPGVKFNDADLLGISLQVVLGEKSLAQGEVELKERRSGAVRKVKLEDASGAIAAWAAASR
ncbi:MAG: proline--tRNA ligase [Nitrospiria bacterium]